VADDEAAIDLMNDTEYGLTAGVYTASEKRAKKILAKVNAGSVYWNCWRPGQPAPAVVRRQAFRHRPDAVDVWHPDVHASQGLAPALALIRSCSKSAGLGYPPATAPRAACWRAESRIVIGPTPPGTGVIQPATAFAASKSTSPQSLPSARRLTPTSMTMAPA
jgi:hypothetical protein